MSFSAKKVIICDNGTKYVKCGFASNPGFPTSFPSVVGRVLDPNHELKRIMVGEEAIKMQSSVDISCPLEDGAVRKWDDMGYVWDYMFYEKLNIEPEECKIVHSDFHHPNRKKTIEIMIEKYGFKYAFIMNPAVMALYGYGLLTGVVIDSGEKSTRIAPVYEGLVVPHSERRFSVAGWDVTRYLIHRLCLSGHNLKSKIDFEEARQIQEKFCYVANDLELEERLAKETVSLVEKYSLPDGRIIKVGAERFQATEILFQPHLIGVEGGGIAQQILNSINAEDDIDIKREFFSHLVLTGGSTMYPGFSSRLEIELTQALKNNLRIENCGSQPTQRVFLGGSVFGEIMKDKEQPWINKTEWYEEGDSVLKKLG